jgi:hypothetical protein
MNLRYVALRLIRHFLPDKWVVFLKNRNILFQPGLETLDPTKAVDRYLQILTSHGISINNKKVMVFGYGGNLAIGCEFLQAGTDKVILVEQKGFSATSDLVKIRQDYPGFFVNKSGKPIPDPEKLLIFHDDLKAISNQPAFEKADLILSNSVFEHVQEPQTIARQLAEMTNPDGCQVHFIDIRDHYFKYPFEMLCYDESTWSSWLNPTNNLNRLRLRDFRDIFCKIFHHVEVITDESNRQEFIKVRNRIRSKFLSGNDEEDSATLIHIFCSSPR